MFPFDAVDGAMWGDDEDAEVALKDSGFRSLTSCTHFAGKYPDLPRSKPSNMPVLIEPITIIINRALTFLIPWPGIKY